MTTHDVAIIGGGIVGLATAHSLTRTHPGLDVVVVEKETELATHQTGRNSGVIHAGLYYAPGSLKARLCVEGADRLKAFCAEHGIRVDHCGKVVVATEETQLPALAELERRAAGNGVPTERLDAAGIADHEPHAAGIAGLWVPVTAVVDFAEVARAYATLASAAGAEIRTGFEVVAAPGNQTGRRLESPAGWVEAKVVVNCGGLHVDRLARMMGLETDIRIIPFRGEYYEILPPPPTWCVASSTRCPIPAFPSSACTTPGTFTAAWRWAPTPFSPSPVRATGGATSSPETSPSLSALAACGRWRARTGARAPPRCGARWQRRLS